MPVTLTCMTDLLIILGYGNDKLRDCALSIPHLRRHPYVLLPIIIIITLTITKQNNDSIY